MKDEIQALSNRAISAGGPSSYTESFHLRVYNAAKTLSTTACCVYIPALEAAVFRRI